MTRSHRPVWCLPIGDGINQSSRAVSVAAESKQPLPPNPTDQCSSYTFRLKCDRQQPCKTCSDRGLSFSCSYARHAPSPAQEQPKTQVHDRIDQLERLVTSLMQAKDDEQMNPYPPLGNQPLSTDGCINPEIPDTPDRVKLEDDTTSYTNSSHWTSILDGVGHSNSFLVGNLANCWLRLLSSKMNWSRFPPSLSLEIRPWLRSQDQICYSVSITMLRKGSFSLLCPREPRQTN